MEKMKKISLLLMSILTLSLQSCKDEPKDPIIPNEEELITTLILTLTPQNGGSDILFSFVDLDGKGGDDPIYTEGVLAPNTAYSGTIQLLNELENPVEDITIEVEEEGIDHQFFYLTTVNGMTISYTDVDDNGNPIGIETMVETLDVGQGTLRITLKHEPDKTASGVSDGDMTNAGGESDIEVTFNVNVQ